MGVTREGFYDHEGYAVGYVTREGCASDSGIYRELGYPDMNDYPSSAIVRIGAACTCGWRSQVFRPRRDEEAPYTGPLPQWMPHIVLLSHYDDELVHKLWDRHIANDCTQETKPTDEPYLRLPFNWRDAHLEWCCRYCLEHHGLTAFRRKARP